MPGLIKNGVAGGKRKRENVATKTNGVRPRKAAKTGAKSDSTQAKILLLEEQILESRTHYNNIVELQSLVGNVEQKPKTATLAAVALCRVFCRLIAGEALAKRNNASEADGQIVQWLKARLRDYVDSLATYWIGSPDASQESTALTLLMRVVKEETSQGLTRSDQAWRSDRSTFHTLVGALLERSAAEGARQEFVEKYVEEHDDVRFYTFVAVRQHLKSLQDEEVEDEAMVGHAIELLSQIEGVPESQEQLEDWYGEPPTEKKHQLHSLNAHCKVAQEAWLAIFRSPLTRDHRKAILNIATTRILPWFTTRMELLTDFLTDSFNEGGSLSLLALSSIFHLITQRNLDYPDFYTKLYSLLDEDVMHSKHRSRFFRLLDTFMSSTHLPAAMVASFIKRLARISLQAPPGAIVWLVPWVYNMLKRHPACTFMLHRPYHSAHAIYPQANPNWRSDGMPNDTFSMSEPDPSHTGAVDSSLWELQTLESHYHPNVATLAKILSEQFTKREYQLEDFLDHSYATLVDAELGKVEMKKVPVVEWEIPKRIVTEEGGGLNRLGGLLEGAMAAA